ncbi:MAG: hypothetical protein PHU70_00465 [Dehalococcoidia bacterium]|nr:hypothetical protein [Dehalococcoidia bacterium]
MDCWSCKGKGTMLPVPGTGFFKCSCRATWNELPGMGPTVSGVGSVPAEPEKKPVDDKRKSRRQEPVKTSPVAQSDDDF